VRLTVDTNRFYMFDADGNASTTVTVHARHMLKTQRGGRGPSAADERIR
jgi:hypothetical protein